MGLGHRYLREWPKFTGKAPGKRVFFGPEKSFCPPSINHQNSFYSQIFFMKSVSPPKNYFMKSVSPPKLYLPKFFLGPPVFSIYWSKMPGPPTSNLMSWKQLCPPHKHPNGQKIVIPPLKQQIQTKTIIVTLYLTLSDKPSWVRKFSTDKNNFYTFSRKISADQVSKKPFLAKSTNPTKSKQESRHP